MYVPSSVTFNLSMVSDAFPSLISRVEFALAPSRFTSTAGQKTNKILRKNCSVIVVHTNCEKYCTFQQIRAKSERVLMNIIQLFNIMNRLFTTCIHWIHRHKCLLTKCSCVSLFHIQNGLPMSFILPAPLKTHILLCRGVPLPITTI